MRAGEFGFLGDPFMVLLSALDPIVRHTVYSGKEPDNFIGSGAA